MDKRDRHAVAYRYIIKDIVVAPDTVCGFEGCKVVLPEDRMIRLLLERFHQAPEFDADLTRKRIWQGICEQHQEIHPAEQQSMDWPLITNFVALADNILLKVDGWLDRVFKEDVDVALCSGWPPFVNSIMLSFEDAYGFGCADGATQTFVAPDVRSSG